MTQRYNRDGIPVYKVKDLSDEPIEGTFYDQNFRRPLSREIFCIGSKKC